MQKGTMTWAVRLPNDDLAMLEIDLTYSEALALSERIAGAYPVRVRHITN